MHFFAMFHISGLKLDFGPDFSGDSQEAGFGEFGRREWYKYKVYFATDISQPMSYQSKRHCGSFYIV
jgi:hypothetical protein